MAAMARVAGIPSRVAVGFTSGVPAGDHWEVGSKDAHAWPELYFPGVGWVRFEPTPRGDGQVDVPSYTTASGRQISPTTTVTTAAGGGNATGTTDSAGNSKLEAENSDTGSQLGTPESGRQKAARRGIVALIVLLMSGEFQEDARPLGELTALYVTAEYAPAEPSSGGAAEARKLARTARSRLAGRLGWRRRVGAVLSPRSLVPPPQRERVGSR